ncbi:MAG: PDZ domain-containing protein, partial [Kiloniellaceae bacterium]|nr:PDZ domain-containing protein [Kiloniellaceae bacterium]
GDGAVERGWLGVQIQDVTEEIADSLGLEEQKGALIVDANAGEPAAEAGIKPGDVVIAVEGESITSPRELARSVGRQKPGASVEVTVWRNGEATNLDVKLGEMPEVDQLAAAPQSPAPSATQTELGLSVTPAEDGNGLVVTDVEPGSAAEDVGFLPGDVVRSVNSQPV